jgi:hypothetical protein
MRAHDVDSYYGRRLDGLFRRTGLDEVESSGTLRMIRGGTPAATLFAMTIVPERLRGELLSGGTVTSSDLESFKTLLDDPEVSLTGASVVWAWGRRPLT